MNMDRNTFYIRVRELTIKNFKDLRNDFTSLSINHSNILKRRRKCHEDLPGFLFITYFLITIRFVFGWTVIYNSNRCTWGHGLHVRWLCRLSLIEFRWYSRCRVLWIGRLRIVKIGLWWMWSMCLFVGICRRVGFSSERWPLALMVCKIISTGIVETSCSSVYEWRTWSCAFAKEAFFKVTPSDENYHNRRWKHRREKYELVTHINWHDKLCTTKKFPHKS